MHYKLLGFSQKGSVRHFAFERVGMGIVSAVFTVAADIVTARRFKLALQDLPSLCSRLLETGGDDQPSGSLVLTEADMSVKAASNRVVAQEDEAKRALRSRRGALAAAARTDKNLVSPQLS